MSFSSSLVLNAQPLRAAAWAGVRSPYIVPHFDGQDVLDGPCATRPTDSGWLNRALVPARTGGEPCSRPGHALVVRGPATGAVMVAAVRPLSPHRSEARVLEDCIDPSSLAPAGSSNVAEKDCITREDSVIGRLSPGGPYDPRPRSWPPGSGFHAQTSVEGCFQARTERLSR
jgi:hypothetical protein